MERQRTSLNGFYFSPSVRFCLIASFGLAVCFTGSALLAQDPPGSSVTAAAELEAGLVFSETPVIDEDDAFVTVRHIVIRGSNFEIGRRLATLRDQRYGGGAAKPATETVATEQLEYFREKFPIHAERMRGVAAAFGGEIDDPTKDFSTLGYGFVQAGCSVVYYPPASTADGAGVFSRNFDFTTGTIDQKKPAAGQQGICAQPYVLELYPDEGYASLALVCYDLLGVVDGVNSEGLTVALLADDELVNRFGLYENAGPQAGLDVLQVGRMLLDTCANVEEAKAALKDNKLYYTSIPCHYIVADRHGASFVWENNREMTEGFVFPGEGKPQATTNFMRFLHEDLAELPAESHPGGSFNRYRTICAAWEDCKGSLTVDAIKQINAAVAARSPTRPGGVPGRTIWHSLYLPEKRSLEVNFYLGEPEKAGGEIQRSKYFTFQLAEPEK